MKNIVVLIALYLCTFTIKAQNDIDFFGIPICDADTTDYISALSEKGFKAAGKIETSTMYVGMFAGVEASVMLVSVEESAKVSAIVLSIDNLNPVKMGSLYAELLQKYMRKYQNMKYDTITDSRGSITTTFHNASGFVALKTEIADRGRSCGIRVYYSCNKENAIPKDKKTEGISLDDI